MYKQQLTQVKKDIIRYSAMLYNDNGIQFTRTNDTSKFHNINMTYHHTSNMFLVQIFGLS